MAVPPTAPRSALRRLLPLLAGVAAMAVLVARFGGGTADRLFEIVLGGPQTEEIRALPKGHWNPVRPAGPGSSDPGGPAPEGPEGPSAEERARLVSLPYLGGRAAAEEAAGVGGRGVTRLDAEAVAPGANLYNSGHGPEAILLDPEGRVLHRWRYPFERAFPGVTPTSDTHFFRRVRLLPGGRLAALYQTGGLVFLDRRSRLLGRCRGNFYNDFWLEGGPGEGPSEGPNGAGRIWTIAKELRSGSAGSARAGGAGRLDDFLVELRADPDGGTCREVRRISITGAFRGSPFADLLALRAPSGDVLHTNTVEELGGPIPGAPAGFAPGNLLISLREIDVVAVVDPEARRVVWARHGPWDAQHEPSPLDGGALLLFDNLGNGGGNPGGSAPRPRGGRARVLEVHPGSGEVLWSWTGDPPGTLSSDLAGSCARLPNGNTLVTESVPGRAYEIDPEGRVVWEFRSPHRAGPDDSLVAMLFEVQRVPWRPER